MTTVLRSFTQSLALAVWHCQWDGTHANMCKDNGDPLKILLGQSEDEILQPLPSNSPECSHSNTAAASKGDKQRLLCTANILLCQHVASAWFCSFRLTCFSNLFKFLFWSFKKFFPCLVFFSYFSFWYKRDRISLRGEGLETTDPFSSAMKMDKSFAKSQTNFSELTQNTFLM